VVSPKQLDVVCRSSPVRTKPPSERNTNVARKPILQLSVDTYRLAKAESDNYTPAAAHVRAAQNANTAAPAAPDAASGTIMHWPTDSLTSAMSDVSHGIKPHETWAASGAGGHEGGQDIVRVPVEVVAGSVISHCGAGVGVPGGDLDIAQVSASVETGCDIQGLNCRGLGLSV